MSKTLKEIGLIVGGLAMALLAGPVGIIVLQGNLAVFQAMVGVGLTTALSGVGLALRPTPKPVGFVNTISFNQGITNRRVGYGQFKTGGVLTYASFPPGQNTVTTNEYLHLVYTLTAHEIWSIDAISIDGTTYGLGTDIQWESADGLWHVIPAGVSTLDDFYWEHMFFEFDFGRQNNGSQPFPALAAADPSWTSAFLQRGCAKVHVILRWDSGVQGLYVDGAIPNLAFLVTGKKIMDPRVVTDWLEDTFYLQYQYIEDDLGRIWIQQNATGTSSPTTRPNFEGVSSFPATLTDASCSWESWGYTMTLALNCSSTVPQGNLWNNRVMNDGWAANTGYTQYVDIIEAPLGYLQQCSTASASTGATEPTAWSTTVGGSTLDGGIKWYCLGRSPHAVNPSNSALCVNDYLQDTDAGMSVPEAAIDESSVIAAANVCEEQELIIYNADDTVVYENLYACDGMFDHSSNRGNVLQSLCNSMMGWCVPPGDFWHVFAGAYITPTLAFTDVDLRDSIKGDFRLSRRDVANSVKGTYNPRFLPSNPGAALSLTSIPGTWQSQSFPAYQANGLDGKPNYLNSEDGGQIIWQDIQLDFTTSLWMAQRLAKIVLMRLRFQETLTLPFKLTAFQLEAGDTFYFSHPRWSIVDGVYEASQCAITLDGKGKDDAPVLGVDIIARQTDPSIYEFQGPTSSTDYGEYSPYGITGIMTGVE